MAHYNSFEEFDVYKKARLLAQQIWQLIQTTGLRNDFELRNQINASSGSVTDNITEGFGRGGYKEFIHFLGIARGSCCEVKSQLLRCLDK